VTYLYWRYIVLGIFFADTLLELKIELESDFKFPRRLLGATDLLAKAYVIYWLFVTVDKF
jgi:hypothetical protein